MTPSRSQSCISCTASCLWRRAGLGSLALPPAAESAAAAAASWTCLQETTARRLGSCSWMCPCSVPSSVAPACLMPCACTAKVGLLPSQLLLLFFWSFPLPNGAHRLEESFSPPVGDWPSISFLLWYLFLVSLLVTPAQSVPFSFSFHPADSSSSSPFHIPVLFISLPSLLHVPCFHSSLLPPSLLWTDRLCPQQQTQCPSGATCPVAVTTSKGGQVAGPASH